MTKSFLKFRPRILAISSMVILWWTILIMRFFYVQVIRSEELRKEMAEQGEKKVDLPSVRGTIYDRNYQPLAENVVHYSFAIHPEQVEDKELLISAFSQTTGRSADFYKAKFEAEQPYVFLERNLRLSESAPLLRLRDGGLAVDRHGYRFYPHNYIVSQIVGFTDVDNTGLSGIEKECNDHLKGKSGWIIVQTDGRGIPHVRSPYPRQEPVDGSNIVLTLDVEYQAILRDELNRRIQETEAAGGMGIIVEPQTGQILAMSSLPDFDPNDRSSFPKETYRNRVIEDQFEPGSTFKIVPAIAALSLNTVSVSDEFNCENGTYIFRGTPIKDWSNFGLLTFPQIIEHSSNVGIIKIAETVGSRNLYQFARKLGFGSATGVRLPGEASGKLRPPKEWSALSLAEISLGHEVSVTTLQLAYAYSAVANGGFLMKPILIDRVIRPSGRIIYRSKPQVIRTIASKKVTKQLTKMLRRAVQSGTGTNADIIGWNVAGKTGTAQKYVGGSYSNSKFISSFVGILPADNPTLVMAVVLDEPRVGYHWGGIGAAPVFREVMKRIINSDDQILAHRWENGQRRGINKFISGAVTETDHEQLPNPPVALWTSSPPPLAVPNTGKVVVPDVRGKSLRVAISVLRQAGLRPKASGSGAVVWQYPVPGIEVNVNTLCQVGLK